MYRVLKYNYVSCIEIPLLKYNYASCIEIPLCVVYWNILMYRVLEYPYLETLKMYNLLLLLFSKPF